MPIVRFTPRPGHFEAMQWDGTNTAEIKAWAQQTMPNVPIVDNGDGTLTIVADGMVGPAIIHVGGWVTNRNGKGISDEAMTGGYQPVTVDPPYSYEVTGTAP